MRAHNGESAMGHASEKATSIICDGSYTANISKTRSHSNLNYRNWYLACHFDHCGKMKKKKIDRTKSFKN